MDFKNKNILKPPPYQVQLEYNLSDEYQDLCSRPQCYMQSQQHISNHTFKDPYFKNMMIFQASVGGGMKGQKPPQLI